MSNKAKTNQESRLCTPTYFSREIQSLDFTPDFGDEDEKPDMRLRRLPDVLEIPGFEDSMPKILDLNYDAVQLKRSKTLLESERQTGRLMESCQQLMRRCAELQCVPLGIYSLFNSAQSQSNIEQTGFAVSDRLQKLETRKQLETKVLGDLFQGVYPTQRQVALSNKVSTYFVSRVKNYFLKSGQIPALAQSTGVRRLVLPPAHAITTVLSQLYSRSGKLSGDWEELIAEMRLRFPELRQFASSTIANHLRKKMSIRLMRHKRIAYKQEVSEYVHRQLCLANIMTMMLAEEVPILYFDQTTINIESFKCKSIGTTQFPPLHKHEFQHLGIHILTLFSLSGFFFFRVARNSANSEEVVQFLSECLDRLFVSRDTGSSGYMVFLDNAMYHRTKKVKDLTDKYPIRLIYSIPHSPFLNLVEDFFLELKRGVRAEQFHGEHRLLELIGQAVVRLKSADFGWILRRFGRNTLAKLDLHQKLLAAKTN